MQIFVRENLYHLRAKPEEVATCRSIPSCRFDGASGCWIAPFTVETHRALARLNVDVRHLATPTVALYRVDTYDRKYLLLHVPFNAENKARCQALPDSRAWNDREKGWVLKPTLANLNYLGRVFPLLTWSAAALALAEPVQAKMVEAAAATVRKQELVQAGDVEVIDYKFHTVPFSHQRVCFMLARDKAVFAMFMEQGTGKTKVNLDVTAYKYLHSQIDAALVVCPNGAKSNWAEDEIPTHLPPWVPRRTFVWEAGLSKRDLIAYEAALADRAGLLIVVMNVEAFAHQKAVLFAERLMKIRRTLMTIDESQKIKSPSAKRTKALIKLGQHAAAREVMTGTPVTQGPLDVYTQMKFLDEAILGFSSFYGFRNHYAVLGGYMGRDVVAYSHLDELQAKLDPFSYRRLRSECLDLPDKIYQKRYVELNPEARQIYDEMVEYMIADMGGGKKASAAIVLTQMTRLQQITGGFVPVTVESDDPLADETELLAIPGENQKLTELLEIGDEVQGKLIVWARFRAEIALIAAALREKYGAEAVVEYHGGVSTDQRTANRRAFQDPENPARWFVGQPQTGGVSLTLTRAKTMIYYSNTFSLEDRLQTEDRAMRIGQDRNLVIIDLVAKNTLDPKVVAALRNKKSLADSVTGDTFREWI